MTHTTWDQVPPIPAYGTPGGTLHPAGENCTHVLDLPWVGPDAIQKVDLLALHKEDRRPMLCTESACLGVIGVRQLDTIVSLIKALEGHRVAAGQDNRWAQVHVLTQNARLLDTDEWGYRHDLGKISIPEVRESAHQLWKDLKSTQEQVRRDLAGPHRAALIRALTTHSLSLPATKAFTARLQEKNLGAPRDLGLLVGPRGGTGPTTLRGVLLDILGEGTGANVRVVAPLAVLRLVVDNDTDATTHLGRRWQAVGLPSGSTPELLETIQGLFDPKADTVMNDLSQVVQASRRILT